MEGNLILVVSNLEHATQYYQSAFGFACCAKLDDYVLVKRDGLTLKLILEQNSAAKLGMAMQSPKSQQMFSPFIITIETDDIDTMYQKALAFGGRAISPITEKFNIKSATLVGIENYTWQLIQTT